MKWAFTFQHKIQAALILAVVFLMVFAKTWLDDRNVARLGNSFSSVYEDRLLAESYIFQLSDHLYQKKLMLDNCSSQEDQDHLQKRIKIHDQAIGTIIHNFEKTKLTEAERACFGALKSNLAAIKKLELAYLANLGLEGTKTKLQIDGTYKNVAGNLQQLSEIQVKEGQILNEESKKIIAGSSILSQFELVVLIGIGLIIQVLIFASKSGIPKKQQPFSLN